MRRASNNLSRERADRLRPALELLLEAHADAESLGRPGLDCALEVRDLYHAGLHTHDLHWLLFTGHVELAPPAVEAMPSQQQRPSPFLVSDLGRCLLTPAGVALARRIIGRSRQAKPPTDPSGLALRRSRPRWNTKTGELWLGTILVKRIKQSASNLRSILDAYQEEHWRECVDDPLSPRHGLDSHQRLHEAVRRLNACQINPLLQFHVVNHGTAIRWELLPRATNVPKKPCAQRAPRERPASAQRAPIDQRQRPRHNRPLPSTDAADATARNRSASG